MTGRTLLWLDMQRVYRAPWALVLTLLGPSLAVALALFVVTVAGAALVRAQIFVGGAGDAQRLFVSRAPPPIGTFGLGGERDSLETALDQHDLKRLAHLPGVQEALPVVHLPLATSVAGGESLLGRRLMVDVLVEGLPVSLAQQDAFAARPTSEEPLRALVHPQLLALYNATVAPGLGLPSLPPSALLGQSGTLCVGRGRLAHRQPAKQIVDVPIVIAGMSSLASPLGISVPAEDARALWQRAMQVAGGPPIKGAWLTVTGEASLVEVGKAVARFGLTVDQQAERGARALALGERAAAATALLVWLAVALSNLQRELSLAREAAQLMALYRLWGTSPQVLRGLRVLSIVARASFATLCGSALCGGANLLLTRATIEMGAPLGINLIALGPPLAIQWHWLGLALLASTAVPALASLLVATRRTRSITSAVC